MFSKKTITVTIGDYGVVIAAHDGNQIKNKVFLNELNDNSKAELKNVLFKNNPAPIYVLIDTIDQSYKRKSYPPIRQGDLIRLIKRDLVTDGSKDNFKNYILIKPKKSSKSASSSDAKRKECLFISSSNSELISQWLEFLLDLPNRLIGIYMLPAESFSLYKSLKNNIQLQSKIKNKKNNLCCLVTQNKTSGFRQTVFSDNEIVFTRVVSYDPKKPDFLEKYEQDIYSTFEYLKRLFPDIALVEIDIVNIFSPETLAAIKNLNNVELNLINYTPFEAASKLKLGNLLPQNSASCDLLISKIFSKESKVLKFVTAKISAFENLFTTAQISYYLNLLLLLACLGMTTFAIITRSSISDKVEIIETKKFNASQAFEKIQKETLESNKSIENSALEKLDIEQMVDFGKMDEVLGSSKVNFNELYLSLKFLKDFNVKLDEFSYSIKDFAGKAPPIDPDYKAKVNGKIYNKSGNIEDLFKEFDSLTAEFKKSLSNYKIKYSELPRDIDFSQKYYDFPIDFTISKK